MRHEVSARPLPFLEGLSLHGSPLKSACAELHSFLGSVIPSIARMDDGAASGTSGLLITSALRFTLRWNR